MRVFILIVTMTISSLAYSAKGIEDQGTFTVYNSESFVIVRPDGKKVRYRYSETNLHDDGHLANLLGKKVKILVRKKK